MAGRNACAVQQQGSMLVMAVFAMVVMALLGLTLTRLLASGSQSVVYDVVGVRAGQAAEAGLMQLALSVTPLNGAAQPCAGTIHSAPAFSAIEGFKGCNYTARCQTLPFTESSTNFYHYELKSTGTCALAEGVASITRTLRFTRQQ
ncbi:type II secretory pathway component [Aestuariibacter sp. A3R04]|uniref:type II secretory pathway component n=1 Tax=Aestuariibacter sp. A3R04 TaxID=2841571 RepID=UPI001C09F87E|nr:type II secretory pathway component [Aestuariibacter sp. A3R04]MBU3020642.1 type II secretory pathway component [Aestuariibacter sp. A3R04]